MFINANTAESPITYWEELKHSVAESDSDGISTTRKNINTSLEANPLYEACYKEETSMYQYYDRNFNFCANVTGGGGTSEDDEYHHSLPKRKITVTRNFRSSIFGRITKPDPTSFNALYWQKMLTEQRFSIFIPNQQTLKYPTNGDFKRVKKRLEDPMSHRIIEKRRRDRMNNCLADLSRLIPTEYLKKGRGRIEKTEIIEMAIRHMKYLQALTSNSVGEPCHSSENIVVTNSILDEQFVTGTKVHSETEILLTDHYKLGYEECFAETMRFLVELQGFFPTDTLCVKLINHLQKNFAKLAKGDKLVSSIHENVTLPSNEFTTTVMDFHGTTIETKKTKANSILSSIHSDDSCQESTYIARHPQEMHDRHHTSHLFPPSAPADLKSHSSPELSSSQMDINDSHSTSSMYKFKNYIRKRFEHSNSDSKPAISSVMVCDSRKRRADSTETLNSSPPMADHIPKCGRPIPIFALHAKGSFYVPLTIDSHLLSPFVTELNGDYEMHSYSPLLLHPVTISVNFNRPTVQACSTSISPSLISYPV